jgi:hypothetical protein
MILILLARAAAFIEFDLLT